MKIAIIQIILKRHMFASPVLQLSPQQPSVVKSLHPPLHYSELRGFAGKLLRT